MTFFDNVSRDVGSGRAAVEARSTRYSCRSMSGELETMRERLVIARVLNGFTVEQAQERVGGKEISIARIEAGTQTYPKDHRFVFKAAQEYAVSADFLFGLTTDPERDGMNSTRYALLRGFEAIIRQQIEATHETFCAYAKKQSRVSRVEYEGIAASVDSLRRSIEVMRQKYGFDDVRGSSAVLSALERVEHSIAPVRKAVASQREFEQLLQHLATGKIGPIACLLDVGGAISLEA
jgi:transcriptional regulator with XRE-family HTH domain